MKGILLKNEPLAKYTSWRVGGPAEKMYLPDGKEDLIEFIAALPKQENIFWLGLGSNLLVRDGGIRGTVINTRRRLKAIHQIDSNKVYVEAGVPCANVARFCIDAGFTGAEFLAGIPGTMGGALAMNAGAFDAETWNIVESVELLDIDGKVSRHESEQFNIGYRTVEGLKDAWFLSAELLLKQGASEDSQQKVRALLEKRAKTQPLNMPTCGSVFMNPAGDYAARLIESSGLKGYAIGDARVSRKHANFIENTGHATAAEIEALIEYIQQQVQQQQGVSLHTEVRRIGETL